MLLNSFYGMSNIENLYFRSLKFGLDCIWVRDVHEKSFYSPRLLNKFSLL